MKTAFLIEPSASMKSMLWYEMLKKEKRTPLLFIETLLNTGNKPPKIQISKWKINKHITQKIKNRNNFESRKLKHHHLSFPVLYASLLLSSSFAQHEIIWSSFTELEQALPTGRWHIHVLLHAVHLRKHFWWVKNQT